MIWKFVFISGHLAQLLFALGEPGSARLDLFGTSMGGAIAVAFGATFPDRVRSLTLIAPAGLGVHVPPSVRALCTPWLGEALMAAVGPRTVRGHVAACIAPNPTPADIAAHGALLALVEGQLAEHPGFLRALLSSLRHTITRDMEPAFAAWGATRTPTLIVWGAQDKVVDFAGSARALRLVPAATLVAIEGVGHNIAAQPEYFEAVDVLFKSVPVDR